MGDNLWDNVTWEVAPVSQDALRRSPGNAMNEFWEVLVPIHRGFPEQKLF